LPQRRKYSTFAPMSSAFHWPDFLPAFSNEAEQVGFTSTVLAETPAGPLMTWERASAGPHVYLSAGMHGDEPAGPLALLELMRAGFFSGPIHWTLCPALNPTGLAAGTRENAAGTDMNRDYLTRHTPEVRAHATWLEAMELPQLFLSLHEDWETRGFYFYEINLGDDDSPRANCIIEAVKPWFAPESGPEIDGHDSRGPGWIFHAAEPDLPEGWPEAIFMAKLGCPLSFTLETPSHAPLASRVAAHCAAVRAACGHMA
jgi:hypothetical protein